MPDELPAPWTVADRNAIKAAILRGESSVRFGERQVNYKSTAELIAILALIDAELVTTQPGPVKQYLGYSSKGF